MKQDIYIVLQAVSTGWGTATKTPFLTKDEAIDYATRAAQSDGYRYAVAHVVTHVERSTQVLVSEVGA